MSRGLFDRSRGTSRGYFRVCPCTIPDLDSTRADFPNVDGIRADFREHVGDVPLQLDFEAVFESARRVLAELEERHITAPSEPQHERQIEWAGCLVPVRMRRRQVAEWLDHVDTERANGGDPRRAVRSIVLRSVVPIAIGSRLRHLRGGLAPPR